MAAPRAKKVVPPQDGHGFVYTVRCVHCGAHQEMPPLEQTCPSHLQRGRGKVLCPWSSTRLSARQMQEASRRTVKKPVARTSTVRIPRTSRKPDRLRELGELNADSVSVSARLGPSQGTGRRR